MGIDDKKFDDLEIASVSAGDVEAEDVVGASIADGEWIIRVLGINDSKGVSGSGKKDKRALVLYVPKSNPNADATPVLIKQKNIARWIPAFTRAESANEAIEAGTKWSLTLTTSNEEIPYGTEGKKFKPQLATNVVQL